MIWTLKDIKEHYSNADIVTKQRIFQLIESAISNNRLIIDLERKNPVFQIRGDDGEWLLSIRERNRKSTVGRLTPSQNTEKRSTRQREKFIEFARDLDLKLGKVGSKGKDDIGYISELSGHQFDELHKFLSDLGVYETKWESENVQAAISRYQSGERPWPHGAFNWFILSGDGIPCPAKYVWALAVGQEPKQFHTNEAIVGLRKAGYESFQIESNETKDSFDGEVAASLRLGQKERAARMAARNNKPQVKFVLTKQYDRSPHVVAEVLLRAKGICESCGAAAPFYRKSDGTPYLEVHHKKQLSHGGDDTVENAIALCPNCHRKSHFG